MQRYAFFDKGTDIWHKKPDAVRFGFVPAQITLLDTADVKQIKFMQDVFGRLSTFSTYRVKNAIARFDDLRARYDQVLQQTSMIILRYTTPYLIHNHRRLNRYQSFMNAADYTWRQTPYYVSHPSSIDFASIAPLSPIDYVEPDWQQLAIEITKRDERPFDEKQQMQIIRESSTSAERGVVWRKLPTIQRSRRTFIRAYVANKCLGSERITFQSLREACESFVLAAERAVQVALPLKMKLPTTAELNNDRIAYALELLASNRMFAESDYARASTSCSHCGYNLLPMSHPMHDSNDVAEYEIASPEQIWRGNGQCNRPNCPNPLVTDAYQRNLTAFNAEQQKQEQQLLDQAIQEREREQHEAQLRIAATRKRIWGGAV